MDDNFAIQLFEGKRVRIVWDAEQYIKKMRARDPELDSKWGTICTPVKQPKKVAKLPVAPAQTLRAV